MPQGQLPHRPDSTTDATGAPPGARAPDSLEVYGVGQIAGYLRELVETDPLLHDLWLAGEVTNLSRSQAGHLYFTLTDDNGALRCVFFRRENLGVAVEQGDQVLVHGRVSLYRERGDLQFYVDALQPEGVGVLHAEYQRLVEQLRAEGLFDAARKRALPRYPRMIGVATSPAGAVWHDIQTVLRRRWPLTALVLAPCRVQGEDAAATIVDALAALNQQAASDARPLDLIIVGRGGGSVEDLWPFNDERLARAIFASALPVISAVGHETDVTIADHVADLRAPTPSAAAELAVPDQIEERARLDALRENLGSALARHADDAAVALAALNERLSHVRPDTGAERLRLDGLTHRAETVLLTRLAAARTTLAGLRGRVAALDPTATLARGYAIVEDARGHTVTSARALRPGQRVDLRFHDGVTPAAITDPPAR